MFQKIYFALVTLVALFAIVIFSLDAVWRNWGTFSPCDMLFSFVHLHYGGRWHTLDPATKHWCDSVIVEKPGACDWPIPESPGRCLFDLLTEEIASCQRRRRNPRAGAIPR